MHNLVVLTEGTAATFDLSSVLQTGVDAVKGDIFTALAIVVPVAIAITGAIVGVRFGLKWLRSLGK